MDPKALTAPLSTVAIKPHLSAAVPYARALQAAGYRLVPHGQKADVYLTDLDISGPAFRPLIDGYVDAGATAFVYPHGVGVVAYYDGIDSAYERTSGMFVPAEGFAEVYRRMDYPHPLYVIGWAHCEIAPFRPSDRPRRVLFAPEHPLESGFLSDYQRELNQEVFRALCEVPGIELTVRHLYALEMNGLWAEPGVTFVQGQPDNAIEDIDRADVVVASGTYSHLAVARGAPMVKFGQNIHPSSGEHGGERIFAANWERWREYVRYPFDMSDGPAAHLIAAAAGSEEPVREWKRRFIGDQLDPWRFSEQLEVARAAAQLPDMRSFAVLADAHEVAAQPGLLAAYATVIGPGDDATLVLLAPGADQTAIVDQLQQAFATAGLEENSLPDLLLQLDAQTRWDMLALAGRAHAQLSEQPAAEPFAAVPAYDAASAGELRAQADSFWAERAGAAAS